MRLPSFDHSIVSRLCLTRFSTLPVYLNIFLKALQLSKALDGKYAQPNSSVIFSTLTGGLSILTNIKISEVRKCNVLRKDAKFICQRLCSTSPVLTPTVSY